MEKQLELINKINVKSNENKKYKKNITKFK